MCKIPTQRLAVARTLQFALQRYGLRHLRLAARPGAGFGGVGKGAQLKGQLQLGGFLGLADEHLVERVEGVEAGEAAQTQAYELGQHVLANPLQVEGARGPAGGRRLPSR